MSTCQSCGARLGGDEKFCGSCGQPVQQATASIEQAQNSAQADPSASPEPEKHIHEAKPEAGKNRTSVFASLAIAILAIGGGFYFHSKSGDAPVPVIAQQPAAAQAEQPAITSNTPPQRSSPLATSATSPNQTAPDIQPETISDAVQDYIKQATQANVDAGIARLAPHRLSVPACSNCAPILIYCVDPIQSASDLKDRAVRAHSTSAKELVQQVGGNLQLMVFGEVAQAMQLGLIDCSMSGGIVPQ